MKPKASKIQGPRLAYVILTYAHFLLLVAGLALRVRKRLSYARFVIGMIERTCIDMLFLLVQKYTLLSTSSIESD